MRASIARRPYDLIMWNGQERTTYYCHALICWPVPVFGLEKLSRIENRGQTDGVDLWPWPMTLTFNPWQVVVMTDQLTHPHAHAYKLNFKGQSVQKIEWTQTSGQTDATDWLTRSVNIRTNWNYNYKRKIEKYAPKYYFLFQILYAFTVFLAFVCICRVRT